MKLNKNNKSGGKEELFKYWTYKIDSCRNTTVDGFIKNPKPIKIELSDGFKMVLNKVPPCYSDDKLDKAVLKTTHDDISVIDSVSKQTWEKLHEVDLKSTGSMDDKELDRLTIIRNYLNVIISTHNHNMLMGVLGNTNDLLTVSDVVETYQMCDNVDKSKRWVCLPVFKILYLPIDYNIDSCLFRIDPVKGIIEFILCGTSGIYCKRMNISELDLVNGIIPFSRIDFIPINLPTDIRINDIFYDSFKDEYVLLCSTGRIINYKIDFDNPDKTTATVFDLPNCHPIAGYCKDHKYVINTMGMGYQTILYDSRDNSIEVLNMVIG